MANLNGFDANTVEPSRTFDPLPAGKYLAAITGTEMKPTKDGTGSYLNIEFTILEGEFKDRKVWDRLCLNIPSKKAVEIAQANLSAICRAVGVMKLHDSVELHNIPLLVTVKLKKREDNGELANEVKGYAKKKVAFSGSPQAASGDNTPPWKR
jgi:hypothetical protein